MWSLLPLCCAVPTQQSDLSAQPCIMMQVMLANAQERLGQLLRSGVPEVMCTQAASV